MDIINRIAKINDLKKLKLIFKNVEQLDPKSDDPNPEDKELGYKDAIVELREGVSYKQILEEQDYQAINYGEFRALADQIEWKHSLEELLEALD